MKSNLKTRLKKYMNPWLIQGKPFEDENIHPDAVGFIYEMEAIIDGKSVKYIGKKSQQQTLKTRMLGQMDPIITLQAGLQLATLA